MAVGKTKPYPNKTIAQNKTSAKSVSDNNFLTMQMSHTGVDYQILPYILLTCEFVIHCQHSLRTVLKSCLKMLKASPIHILSVVPYF